MEANGLLVFGWIETASAAEVERAPTSCMRRPTGHSERHPKPRADRSTSAEEADSNLRAIDEGKAGGEACLVKSLAANFGHNSRFWDGKVDLNFPNLFF